jgi:hypothetical protein
MESRTIDVKQIGMPIVWSSDGYYRCFTMLPYNKHTEIHTNTSIEHLPSLISQATVAVRAR